MIMSLQSHIALRTAFYESIGKSDLLIGKRV